MMLNAIPGHGKRRRSSFQKAWIEHREKYLMIMPFGIIFVTFTVLPVAAAIVISLTSFNMVEMPDYVGLANYLNLLANDSVFLIAIKNTLLFAVITGPISYIMCFMFAWLINGLPKIARALMTLVFYAPSISGNAYMIWKLVFSSDANGYANALLSSLGMIQKPILWFADAGYVMPLLIIVQLWLSLGVSFLAFIAGLKTVDVALYEAGAIDGIRNRWQELWFITLPSMKPQLMFGAVMQITASFSVSTISLELAGFPSVQDSGTTILTHLHDYGTVRMEMGYASAIATVLFVMMLVTNLLVQKMLRKVGQ